MSTQGNDASDGLSGRLAWILRPLPQLGFAGFCALLLGMQIWLLKRDDHRFEQLLEMQRANHQVQRETNQTIEDLSRAIGEFGRTVNFRPSTLHPQS